MSLSGDDSLEGLAELRTHLLHSWFKFIAVKTYRLKSIKAKCALVRVQENPGTSFQVSFPMESHGPCLILPAA